MKQRSWLHRNLFLTVSLIILVPLSACQSFGITPAQTATWQPTQKPSPAATINPDKNATLAAEMQISPSALTGTKIEFWHPLSGNSGEVLNQLVNEFNQTNPNGIFVVPTGYNSENELVKAMDSAGDLQELYPAVIAAPLNQLDRWEGEADLLVDLSPYIHNPDTGWTAGQIADLFPSFLQQGLSGSVQWSVPAYQSGQVLFYNQTWAHELGFSNPPQTLKDFQAQACAAAAANLNDKKKANDGTGGWLIDTGWETTLSWLYSFGFIPQLSTTGGAYQFSTPAVESAFAYIRELYDKGCAWSGKKLTPYEYFSTRQAIFYTGSLEDIPQQIRAGERLGSKDNWIPISFPGELTPTGILSTSEDYAIIQGDAKSQMAAWIFIKWMLEARQHARLAEADTTFPLSYSEVAVLNSLGEKNPQWQQALGLISSARSAPTASDWWIVRHILEDAFWKSLQSNVKVEDIPVILRELDATIHEVLNR